MRKDPRGDLPTREQLNDVFSNRYGDPATMGWGPRRRRQFDYFLPAEMYEAAVACLVIDGCRWIDVGGGSTLFPGNEPLARTLVSRCSRVVALDPSDNVLDNVLVHERVHGALEVYRPKRPFDLATLRMVVEHVADPEGLLGGLARVVRPGGTVVVFTVNLWSPVTVVSRFTPFWIHHLIKRMLWDVDERDTFPVEYKMNTRKTLDGLFERHGFSPVSFAYLDDLSVLSGRKYLGQIELFAWRNLARWGIRYPENCLLGIYRKRDATG